MAIECSFKLLYGSYIACRYARQIVEPEVQAMQCFERRGFAPRPCSSFSRSWYSIVLNGNREADSLAVVMRAFAMKETGINRGILYQSKKSFRIEFSMISDHDLPNRVQDVMRPVIGGLAAAAGFSTNTRASISLVSEVRARISRGLVALLL